MRVKICGVTRLEDAVLAADFGAWAVGMVFAPKSRRRVSVTEAEAIGAALRRRVEVAGVFVNEPLERITALAERVGLTLVQLHGDEGPAFCGEVARRTGARVIKAASVEGAFTLRDLERFHTDFHLLDGHVGRRARRHRRRRSTGRWSRTRRSQRPADRRGGLDAGRRWARRSRRTRPYAVDVASGVESAPGIKDPDRLRAFLDAAHEVAV